MEHPRRPKCRPAPPPPPPPHPPPPPPPPVRGPTASHPPQLLPHAPRTTHPRRLFHEDASDAHPDCADRPDCAARKSRCHPRLGTSLALRATLCVRRHSVSAFDVVHSCLHMLLAVTAQTGRDGAGHPPAYAFFPRCSSCKPVDAKGCPRACHPPHTPGVPPPPLCHISPNSHLACGPE